MSNVNTASFFHIRIDLVCAFSNNSKTCFTVFIQYNSWEQKHMDILIFACISYIRNILLLDGTES